MKLCAFLSVILLIFINAVFASAPVNTNVVTCPQHISGIFTLYGSHDVIQNGVTWNYGPFSRYTPASIQLDDVNTTNQIGGMTPGLVMPPAVICMGEVNGAKFVFMANPFPQMKADDFHDYPVGTIGWAVEFY